MASSGGIDPASLAIMGAVQGIVANPESMEQFMSYERGEDVEVDGEAAGIFNSSLICWPSLRAQSSRTW